MTGKTDLIIKLGFHAIIIGIICSVFCGVAQSIEENLVFQLGQFTGRIRIGDRDILSADDMFYASFSIPFGYESFVSINGTYWNGVDFSGPFDDFGYRISVQSITSSLDLVKYTIFPPAFETSSGINDDRDYLRFPDVSDQTVAHNDHTVVEFKEPAPWIVDADVTNLGCPTAEMHTFFVLVESDDAGPFTEAWSPSSESVLDGSGHQVRFLDLPVLSDREYKVTGKVYLYGASAGVINLSAKYFDVSDVDPVTGHVTISWTVSPSCGTVNTPTPGPGDCTTAGLSGDVELAGALSPDSVSEHRLTIWGPSYTVFKRTMYNNPGLFDSGLTLLEGEYYIEDWFLQTIFNSDMNKFLVWPFSGSSGWDFPYSVNVACDESAELNFIAGAAFINGTISWSCNAKIETKLFRFGRIYAEGMDEGTTPDGYHLGSYGGLGLDHFIVDNDEKIGSYRLIVVPGHWNVFKTTAELLIDKPADLHYPHYVNQRMIVEDYRFKAASPADSEAIELVTAGDTATRDFSYEIGELIINFMIDADTVAERQLRSPILWDGTGTLEDASHMTLYHVYQVRARGRAAVLEISPITMYLPIGEYEFQPWFIRHLDGTEFRLPEVAYGVECINEPPVCNMGGPYEEECVGDITTIMLDGTGSYDPDNDDMEFLWTTDCPGGDFDDPTGVAPVLIINNPPPCPMNCQVSLTVTDSASNSSSCATGITVTDSYPPILMGVPDDITVECDAVPDPAEPVATDQCDSDPGVEFTEIRTDGDCEYNYAIQRTWTSTDDCENETTQSQTITVQDTTPPEVFCAFDSLMDDEDEDMDEHLDETIDGYYRINILGEDNCSDVQLEAFLDVYGTDESCDDEYFEFPGFPVNNEDLVYFVCNNKVSCFIIDDEDDDEDMDPLIHITGPGMILTLTGIDECANIATTECIIECYSDDEDEESS